MQILTCPRCGTPDDTIEILPGLSMFKCPRCGAAYGRDPDGMAFPIPSHPDPQDPCPDLDLDKEDYSWREIVRAFKRSRVYVDLFAIPHHGKAQ